MIFLLFASLAALLEGAQSLGSFLKKGRQVRKHGQRIGAEMMFDAFDVRALSFRIEPEEGKETRERGMAMLNGEGHGPPSSVRIKPRYFSYFTKPARASFCTMLVTEA